jgi:CBS domain-containing protein/mannitol/fructose-specific phosphotransferase system IIA component (Ntr-type)
MKFVSMLDEELLLENIPGNSRAAVYTFMLEKLANYAELTLDIPAIVQEMMEHENDSGMVFPGIAMPHLRINGLHDLFIVIGLPEKSDGMNKNQTADMIFMSLIGEGMSDIYLKMLSSLARHMSSHSAAEALSEAAKSGKNALWNYFQNSSIKLRQIVTAEDVMSPADTFIHPDAPLSDAFDMLSSNHQRTLPVVDSDHHLLGEISSVAVVKKFFPEYVFMMENLNFLNDFAIFNEIFNSEHSLPVSEYMNTTPAIALLDTPLIQITLQLAKQGSGNVYIVDAENHLKGIFNIDNVISKVLRG